MEELKLGIITCLHGNIKAAKAFAKFYSKADIDALIFAGDTAKNDNQDENEVYKMIKEFKKTKLPIYIIPGNHETYNGYKDSLKKLRSKKVIDCSTKKDRRIKVKGYELVFLPGGDALAYKAGFRIVESIKEWKGKMKELPKEHKDFFSGIKQLIEAEEIKKYVKDPKKTIIISHIPPKFNKKHCIDVARFGIAKKDFVIKPKDVGIRERQHLVHLPYIEKGDFFSLEKDIKLVKKGYPIEIKEKNVGNKELKKVIKQLKITKFVCGHIHESGQKANDLKGNLIKQNKWVKELFYNAAPSFKGYSGIFTIKDDKAKYKNIKVKL